MNRRDMLLLVLNALLNWGNMNLDARNSLLGGLENLAQPSAVQLLDLPVVRSVI